MNLNPSGSCIFLNAARCCTTARLHVWQLATKNQTNQPSQSNPTRQQTQLATRNSYPPIPPLRSISRCIRDQINHLNGNQRDQRPAPPMSTHHQQNPTNSPADLKRAMADIKQYSVDHEPTRWAYGHSLVSQQYLLEVHRSSRPTRAADKAIKHIEEALKVFTEKNHAPDFAAAQYDLARLYRQRVAGNCTENLTKALACAKTALRVCKHASCPFPDVARLYELIGVIYADHDFESSNSRAANDDLAIRHYLASLERSSMNDDSGNWAYRHMRVGLIYHKGKNGKRRSNSKVAIKHLVEASKVFTKSKDRNDWATTHQCLALSYWQLINSADYAASLAIMSKEEYTEQMSTLVEKCIASSTDALQVLSTTYDAPTW
jgi:tetratricopeptide (TPR) repeat protein